MISDIYVYDTGSCTKGCIYEPLWSRPYICWVSLFQPLFYKLELV